MNTLKSIIGVGSLLLLLMTSCEFVEPVPHESVDLGLSVEWATCNVGASYPEEFGDYFAWGERYSGNGFYESYKWRESEGEISWYSKYWFGDKYADNKTKLDLYDDAASAKWGANWRMPTLEEVDELVAKCTWLWTTKNGVNGYKVVGPNGYSIFLPASGKLSGGKKSYVGTCGYYWSSSLYKENPMRAYVIYTTEESVGNGNAERYVALPIRPVRK